MSHSGIADATVIGIPDGSEGGYDIIRAYVVCKIGEALTEEEIKEHVKSKCRLLFLFIINL